MAPIRPPDDSPALRAGQVYTEAELASACRALVARDGRTQEVLAVLCDVPRAALAMALDFEKYPTRGHSARRAVLRVLGGFDAAGPLFRLTRTPTGPVTAAPPRA